MTKMKYDSKYRELLQESQEHVKKLKEIKEQQQALGLVSNAESSSQENIADINVSAETMSSLKDAKRKLAFCLKNSNGSGQQGEVWLRMMVDYWENKRLMEQSYNEYHLAVSSQQHSTGSAESCRKAPLEEGSIA